MLILFSRYPQVYLVLPFQMRSGKSRCPIYRVRMYNYSVLAHICFTSFDLLTCPSPFWAEILKALLARLAAPFARPWGIFNAMIQDQYSQKRFTPHLSRTQAEELKSKTQQYSRQQTKQSLSWFISSMNAPYGRYDIYGPSLHSKGAPTLRMCLRRGPIPYL